MCFIFIILSSGERVFWTKIIIKRSGTPSRLIEALENEWFFFFFHYCFRRRDRREIRVRVSVTDEGCTTIRDRVACPAALENLRSNCIVSGPPPPRRPFATVVVRIDVNDINLLFSLGPEETISAQERLSPGNSDYALKCLASQSPVEYARVYHVTKKVFARYARVVAFPRCSRFDVFESRVGGISVFEGLPGQLLINNARINVRVSVSDGGARMSGERNAKLFGNRMRLRAPRHVRIKLLVFDTCTRLFRVDFGGDGPTQKLTGTPLRRAPRTFAYGHAHISVSLAKSTSRVQRERRQLRIGSRTPCDDAQYANGIGAAAPYTRANVRSFIDEKHDVHARPARSLGRHNPFRARREGRFGNSLFSHKRTGGGGNKPPFVGFCRSPKRRRHTSTRETRSPVWKPYRVLLFFFPLVFFFFFSRPTSALAFAAFGFCSIAYRENVCFKASLFSIANKTHVGGVGIIAILYRHKAYRRGNKTAFS